MSIKSIVTITRLSLDSSRLDEASQPTLEGVPSDEGTPSPLRESKKEEQADDGMGFAEDSPIVNVQVTIALSSKSEEVLLGFQNMSINDSVASSRVIDNSIRVEYYPTGSEFFNFDAL